MRERASKEYVHARVSQCTQLCPHFRAHLFLVLDTFYLLTDPTT